jgi:hypothetical protein
MQWLVKSSAMIAEPVLKGFVKKSSLPVRDVDAWKWRCEDCAATSRHSAGWPVGRALRSPIEEITGDGTAAEAVDARENDEAVTDIVEKLVDHHVPAAFGGEDVAQVVERDLPIP